MEVHINPFSRRLEPRPAAVPIVLWSHHCQTPDKQQIQFTEPSPAGGTLLVSTNEVALARERFNQKNETPLPGGENAGGDLEALWDLGYVDGARDGGYHIPRGTSGTGVVMTSSLLPFRKPPLMMGNNKLSNDGSGGGGGVVGRGATGDATWHVK